VVDQSITPVSTVQLLDTIVLRIAVKEYELGDIEVTGIVDLGPTTCGDIDRSYVDFGPRIRDAVA
jgi:hypothetical protein